MFSNVYSFTGADDGNWPHARLSLSGNTIYGTTVIGGLSGVGTVYKVNTDGTGYQNLHSFTTTSGNTLTNSDGANPYGGLVVSGNYLFGTARNGGALGQFSGSGTIFRLNTDGTGFTNMHNFAGRPTDAAYPFAGLILSGNTLYGTTEGGGFHYGGGGSVFAINTDGTGYRILHYFAYTDGATPEGGLVLSGNVLYGTTEAAGLTPSGTIFAINTDGTGFTTLYNFTATTSVAGIGSVNLDGASPYGGLVLSGNTLYGTAQSGGVSGSGTVFAINTDGTGFTNLYNFTSSSGGINSDGFGPVCDLMIAGNTLFGMAAQGGSSGYGTVFSIQTDGTGFGVVHTFNGVPGTGVYPESGLIMSGSTLYGTGYQDVNGGPGAIFSLSFRPHLSIGPSAGGMVLSWPTNVSGLDGSGFTLQWTTNPNLPRSWAPVSPAPVVVNGKYSVTTPVSSTRMYFRLTK
jgi:uncharacterized repeat protein (TIGR03803 family)